MIQIPNLKQIVKTLTVFATCWILTNGEGQSTVDAVIRLVTYNTGLTPRVRQYEVRKEGIWDALTKVEADIFCLQEVWYYKNLQRIVEKTRATHSYSYSAWHNNVDQLAKVPITHAPCFSVVFVEFLTCVLTSCASEPDTASYVMCARNECHMLEMLDQECITCLVMSPDVQSCLDFGNAFNTPGLLLLSNRPLQNVELRRFVPDRKLLIPRAFISAEVESVGLVTCTHTTANLGPVYYEALDYDSWQDQLMSETRTLLQYQASANRAIIMGDLNSSPASRLNGIEPDMQGAFRYLTTHGYTASYMEAPAICTWCTYNPLTDDQKNLVLDHILTKNINSTSAVRVLDQNIKGKNFPYSDHFGIELVIQEP